mmetsp:Transcript_20303/g.30128  ORF Transcript_20303/g.30128 Transcript_20303/m.30128 type:complete len:607 (-) Transcript_20303:1125-2945(-)
MEESKDRNSVDDTGRTSAKQQVDDTTLNNDGLVTVRAREKNELSLLNSRGYLSKRDLIRKTLREKEKQLNNMMKSPSLPAVLNEGNNGDQSSPPTIIMLEGKQEADRREAIKVLSQAALHLKRKLSVQRDNSIHLQKKAAILVSSLEKKQDEKCNLEIELEQVRSENEHNVERLQQVQNELREKTTLLGELQSQNEYYRNKELRMQNELSLWTHRDSMSKAEQIEYFEYQLFQKNNEIDDLRKEVNKMLQKIVELEVDLEIHQDRFRSSNTDGYSKLNSEKDTNPTSLDDFLSKEASAEPSSQLADEKKRRPGFGGLKRIFRKKESTKTTESVTTRTTTDGGEYIVALSCANNDFKILEARYKKDKRESRIHIEHLKQEREEHLVKILSLEKSLESNAASDESIDNVKNCLSSMTVLPNGNEEEMECDFAAKCKKSSLKDVYVNDTIQALKNLRDLHVQTIENLRGDIDIQRVEAEKKLSEEKKITEIKEVKIAALECELAGATAGNDDLYKAVHLKNVTRMESQLHNSMSEVARLRKEQKIKDDQIETLRRETIELRLLRLQDEKKASLNAEDQIDRVLTSINEDDVESDALSKPSELMESNQIR